MLTQLQLEGPELEPLLVRVRSELGSAARIVQAEKVRSGGVAGFFARERYELTVEVDDAQPRSAAPVSPAGPPGLSVHHVPTGADGLSVHHEGTGAAAGQPAGTGQATAPGTAEVSPGGPAVSEVPHAVPSPPAPSGTAFAAVTGLGGPVDRPSDAWSAIPGLRTGEQVGTHDAVVAALTGAAQARLVGRTPMGSAPAAATAGVLLPEPEVFATHPAFPALAERVPAGRPAAAPPDLSPAPVPRSLLELADEVSDHERAAAVSTDSPSFAALLSQLGSLSGDPLVATPDASAPSAAGPPAAAVAAAATATVEEPTSAAGPSPAVPAAPVVVPEQRTAAAGIAVRYATPAQPTATQATAQATAVQPTAPQVAAAQAAAALPTGPHGTGAEGTHLDAAVPASAAVDSTAGALARLGLPAHLHPMRSDQQLHTALRAALTRLPTAPPATNRAGGVLAVVGPLALALRVAREIAEELGLPVPTSVAVATAGDTVPAVAARQVLHAPAEAADRRAAWRRRGNLTVVAVEAPLTATGAADARDFLTALSPSATWGVVEATRKAQDIGAWTRALGGVHALALTDVEETADPAAVLELGIPVSRLGGRPATPRAWATLLTGRLAA